MLEVKTILFSNLLLNACICVGMWIYYRTQRTFPGFKPWMWSNLTMFFLYGLFFLRAFVDLTWVIPIANTMGVLTAVFRFNGLHSFLGKKPRNHLYVLLPLPVLLLLGYYTFIDNAIVVRNLIVTLPIAAISLWIAWIVFTGPKTEPRHLYWLSGANALALSLVLIGRAALWVVDAQYRSLFEPSLLNLAFYGGMLVFDTTWAATFLLLNGQRLTIEVTSLKQQLEELASTDSLTGALNRRKFFELGQGEIARARRYNHAMSVLMFDIDRFKQINDQLSHAAGDWALKHTVKLCLGCLRTQDILGRLGGDEFAVILPETDLAGARQVADRLEHEMKTVPVAWDAYLIYIKLSIGCAQLTAGDDALDVPLHRADLELYALKKKRHNAPVIIQEIATSDTLPTRKKNFPVVDAD